ncbi:hypothetical protein PR048_025166 [Dryococelus australis]|uniref:Uncharacterized protein n=1 Tax=Dryococelus australis TaxID=614101 RepID=A0ABQ9GQN2_9NEOP|nr:hypothetical protein PR048_025166 [Dryococelus australis]
MSLKPKVQNGVFEWLCDGENKIQQWYNRRAGRKEVAFDKGQNIVERTIKDKYWETGKIVGKHEAPQLYWVLNHKENVVQRTTSDLKPSLNEYNPKLDYSDLEKCNTRHQIKITEVIPTI